MHRHEDLDEFGSPEREQYYGNASALSFNHPHLSPPLHIFQKKTKTYTIMEPAVEYPIERLLVDQTTGELTEKKIIKIMKQILTALKFLHNKNLIAVKDGSLFPVCDVKNDWVMV